MKRIGESYQIRAGDRSKIRVTIFGGSGFVGRHVVRALARRGYRIRVAVRRPERGFYLQPAGNVGQIHCIPANISDRASVRAALKDADVAINLVGIAFEKGKQKFPSLHREGAGIVAQEAREAGLQHLIHMSATGADLHSSSQYARTKAQGEAEVQKHFPDAILLRPSLIFGPEDHFFNLFASLARISPILPVVGANSRFQPIFVGDVAEFIARTLEDRVASGTLYELGGPDIVTMHEMLEILLKITGRRRLLLPLPHDIAWLMASMFELLRIPLLTVDQVRLLEQDHLVSEEAKKEHRTLAAADLVPNGMHAILATYLARFRPASMSTSLSGKI